MRRHIEVKDIAGKMRERIEIGRIKKNLVMTR